MVVMIWYINTVIHVEYKKEFFPETFKTMNGGGMDGEGMDGEGMDGEGMD
jgi:hypothetical protein